MERDKPKEKDGLGELYDAEKALFDSACDVKQDPVLTILRVHLLTEHYLERLIHLSLPRADRVINAARLSYYQKLILVDSCNVIPDQLIQSLKGLNRVRNHCAHELEKTISWSEVELIAQPMGKLCTKWQRESKRKVPVFLTSSLSYICGFLTGHVGGLEEAKMQRIEEDHD